MSVIPPVHAFVAPTLQAAQYWFEPVRWMSGVSQPGYRLVRRLRVAELEPEDPLNVPEFDSFTSAPVPSEVFMAASREHPDRVRKQAVARIRTVTTTINSARVNQAGIAGARFLPIRMGDGG